MAKESSRDMPLFELTLRKYERPYNVTKRELVKKLCLSLGLLNPGDSRDIIVDIFYSLLDTRKVNKELTSEEIREQVILIRQNEKLPLVGIAASNIRRQLRRLKALYIIDRAKGKYRISEGSTLTQIFNEKIEKFLLPSTIERLKEYLKEVDNRFE